MFVWALFPGHAGRHPIGMRASVHQAEQTLMGCFALNIQEGGSLGGVLQLGPGLRDRLFAQTRLGRNSGSPGNSELPQAALSRGTAAVRT